MADVKLLKEEGFVLGKEIRKATEEFTGRDGRVVPAQPERYIVTVIVSSMVDNNNGMKYITKFDVRVEKTLFDKLKYLQKIEAVYEYVTTATGGIPKPLELHPLDAVLKI